jgi:hypothetical protein
MFKNGFLDVLFFLDLNYELNMCGSCCQDNV